MVVCASGSERQPTAPAHIHLDPMYLQSILPVTLAWLYPFLPYIPPIDLDVDAFCDLEPPEMPTLTPEDLINLIAPNKIGLSYAAGNKIAQLVHVFLWYKFCKCSTGSTPAAPSAPEEPAGAPQINPTTHVTLPSAQPCAVVRQNSYDNPGTISTPGATLGSIEYFEQLVPTGCVPFGSTLRVKLNHVTAGASHPEMNLRVKWEKCGGGTDLGQTDLIPVPPNRKTDFDFPLFPNSVEAVIEVLIGSTSTDLIGGEFEVYCGAPPGQTSLDVCGPDPRTIGLLTQIYNLLTLVQRQAVPFAYVPGSTHTPLSGVGEIAISAQIGLTVAFETLPAHLGMAEGSPDRIFDAGYIALGTADGWHPAQRVTSSPFFMRVGGEITKVGYAFSPGVVASIQMHEREP